MHRPRAPRSHGPGARRGRRSLVWRCPRPPRVARSYVSRDRRRRVRRSPGTAAAKGQPGPAMLRRSRTGCRRSLHRRDRAVRGTRRPGRCAWPGVLPLRPDRNWSLPAPRPQPGPPRGSRRTPPPAQVHPHGGRRPPVPRTRDPSTRRRAMRLSALRMRWSIPTASIAPGPVPGRMDALRHRRPSWPSPHARRAGRSRPRTPSPRDLRPRCPSRRAPPASGHPRREVCPIVRESSWSSFVRQHRPRRRRRHSRQRAGRFRASDRRAARAYGRLRRRRSRPPRAIRDPA